METKYIFPEFYNKNNIEYQFDIFIRFSIFEFYFSKNVFVTSNSQITFIKNTVKNLFKREIKNLRKIR